MAYLIADGHMNGGTWNVEAETQQSGLIDPNTLHLQQPGHLSSKANRGIAFALRSTTFINRLAITDVAVITYIQGREMKRLVWVCTLFWSVACLREQWCVDRKLNLNLEE